MSNKPKKKVEKNLTKELQLEKEVELLCGENVYFKKAPSFMDKFSEPTAKVESRIIHSVRSLN